MISIVLLLVFSLAEGHSVDVNTTKDGVSSYLIFFLLIFFDLNLDFNFFHSWERKYSFESIFPLPNPLMLVFRESISIIS